MCSAAWVSALIQNHPQSTVETSHQGGNWPALFARRPKDALFARRPKDALFARRPKDALLARQSCDQTKVPTINEGPHTCDMSEVADSRGKSSPLRISRFCAIGH
jgi:hypothetical protein